ncbi:hypothetical protein GCM10011503_24840 [Henriciella pelagia]|uniref:Uncharacterized protein n=1 Tax=Henriciella pelagia TaxID=1977912 RepID=A0ABQ1JRS8_9PROT|nr:hypothetical protein GCM10011503_24840 [Henriciella pelagia]
MTMRTSGFDRRTMADQTGRMTQSVMGAGTGRDFNHFNIDQAFEGLARFVKPSACRRTVTIA